MVEEEEEEEVVGDKEEEARKKDEEWEGDDLWRAQSKWEEASAALEALSNGEGERVDGQKDDDHDWSQVESPSNRESANQWERAAQTFMALKRAGKLGWEVENTGESERGGNNSGDDGDGTTGEGEGEKEGRIQEC